MRRERNVSFHCFTPLNLPKAGTALTRREMELVLSETEFATGGQTGQAAWISKGLKVEETQYVIQ